ncbi:MAG: InlB B-repeat-containing protein [Treponema sp.]|nr:InlB B-repeat-containing protein [Treponema sp.]
MSAEGRSFGGWDFDFDDPIVEPTTVTAAWTIRRFTVNFEMHGGSPQEPEQTVDWNTAATRPQTSPERDGYTFANWYTAASGGTEFDFGAPITEPTTVHARWEAVKAPTPTVTAVRIHASPNSMLIGGTRRFTATVEGTNNPPQTVTWWLAGTHHPGTSIDQATGILTVSPEETLNRTLTIGVASVIDMMAFDNTTVTVTPPMFWWGTFIPQPANFQAFNWAMENFDIDELVETREVSRRVTGANVVLLPGEPVPSGPPVVWTEAKNTAEFISQTSLVTTGNGYHFIITPRRLSDITIGGLTDFNSFTETIVDIDNFTYYVYHAGPHAGPTTTLDMVLIYQ